MSDELRRLPLVVFGVWLGYVGMALVVTWPLVVNWGTHLPLGSEVAVTVPLLNLWTLQWNGLSLAEGYVGFWDAPIFYPAGNTFSYSEPQPATGFLFALINLLAQKPILSYNFILLLTLSLNGLTSYGLFRYLKFEPPTAFLSGLLVVSLHFALNELGVLQLLVIYPVILTFTLLLAFSRSPNLKYGVGLSGAVTLMFFTCGYWGLFGTVFILWGGAVFMRRALWQTRPGLHLLAAITITTILVLPFLLQQQKHTAQFTRSTASVEGNSAQLIDYARPGRAHNLQLPISGGSAQRLYPGFILTGLALLGATFAWQTGQRRWAVFCVSGAVLALLLSFGLNLNVGEIQPYQWVRNHIPGFARIRSPFRFAMFVHLFLALLAGFAIRRAWQKLPKLTALLVVVGLAELSVLPVSLYEFPQNKLEAEWVAWLKEESEGDPAGSILMLPFAQTNRVEAFEPTTIAMLQSLEHGYPLVNGYSGFFPPTYRHWRDQFNRFPSVQTLDLLTEEIKPTYLVIDQTWWTEEKAGQLDRLDHPLHLVYEDSDKRIYAFEGLRTTCH